MMHSTPLWCDENQERARRTNAPADAIYHEVDRDTRTITWKTFNDVTCEETRERIHNIMRNRGWLPTTWLEREMSED